MHLDQITWLKAEILYWLWELGPGAGEHWLQNNDEHLRQNAMLERSCLKYCCMDAVVDRKEETEVIRGY